MGWQFLTARGKQPLRHSVCFHNSHGDALSRGVMKIAPFITGGQQISWTLAPCFSLSPWDRCQRVGRDAGRKLCSGTTKNVGLKSEVESRSDCKLLWDQKGPEQTEDHESRAEQKKPHFSAESKDQWVYLPRLQGGGYLRKIPQSKASSFLSGPGFTGTRVAVLPPSGSGRDSVIHVIKVLSDWIADFLLTFI